MTSDPSTVQKLNEEYLEFNFSCSEVITQPLYCPKSDVEIGYVEVSLYRQQKHGFFREVVWDKVSKGQLISECTEVGRAPLIHFQKIFFKKGF